MGIIRIDLMRIYFLLFFIFFPSFTWAAFEDVSGNHPNFAGIEYVERLEIVKGYPDKTYRPNNKINRAEFIKIIIGSWYSEVELQACDVFKMPFQDVPKRSWFAPFVCLAHQKGIITGYPDGTFRPHWNIQFTEAAKVIIQTYNYPVGVSETWFEPFVVALEERVAIPSTITGLTHFLTRGEMAEVVYRLREGIRTNVSKTFQALAGRPAQVRVPPKEASKKPAGSLPTEKEVSLTPHSVVKTPPPIGFDECGSKEDFLKYDWLSEIEKLEQPRYEIAQICYSKERNMAIILGAVSPNFLAFESPPVLAVFQYFVDSKNMRKNETKYLLGSLELSGLLFGGGSGFYIPVYNRLTGDEYVYNHINQFAFSNHGLRKF